MKLLLSLLTVLFLTSSVSAEVPIPAGAVSVGSGPVADCYGTIILKHVYMLPDGGTFIVLKEPNKAPRLAFRYKEAPDEGGEAYEVWDDDKKVTMEELRSRYARLCDAFITA